MKKSINMYLTKGNITEQNVDCIVNAANMHLRPGSGVCGAIYKKAGFDNLKAETDTLGPVPVGCSVLSGSYDLETEGIKGIIHTVGPIYEDGLRGEAALLASAYQSALQTARMNGFKSIAFPCISTGVYKYPRKNAAALAVATVANFLQTYPDGFEVVFVAFETEDYDYLKEALENYIVWSKTLIESGIIDETDIEIVAIPAAPTLGDGKDSGTKGSTGSSDEILNSI